MKDSDNFRGFIPVFYVSSILVYWYTGILRGKCSIPVYCCTLQNKIQNIKQHPPSWHGQEMGQEMGPEMGQETEEETPSRVACNDTPFHTFSWAW